MEDWKVRLLVDQKELKEKFVKLVEFINSEEYYKLSDNVHFTSYGYLRKAMYMKYAINNVIKANESVLNDKIWSGT